MRSTCCKSCLSTCALMTVCLLYNKVIIYHVHVQVCGWLLSTERKELPNSVYCLSSMLSWIALRGEILEFRSWRCAMTMVPQTGDCVSAPANAGSLRLAVVS